MTRILICFLVFFLNINSGFSQEFGNFPKIEKDKLLRDLEILYQSLDKYHSGMYWYTSKDSVYLAFQKAKTHINRDLNVLEFHKLIAPLVALSREDHTNISLSKEVKNLMNKEITFLPLRVVFLGEKMFCLKNGSTQNIPIDGLEIELINEKNPKELVTELGSLFASDGYIKTVKFNDLNGFSFSKYLYYYYGLTDNYAIKFKNQPEIITLKSLKIDEINENFKQRYTDKNSISEREDLELVLIKDTTAYLGIHSFANSIIKKNKINKNLKSFLKQSFAIIKKNKITTLIIDVSNNGGGNEGNEGLLFSYLGNNYQKYTKVRAKTQKVILDNGVDKPIKIKTFGFFERVFMNKKMKDGSYERRKNIGFGLMAYKKEPKNKFKGNIFVIISPVTYSGASEFSNMMYSNSLATFVGQETGGGYYGNTSGYSKNLVLPHSKITVEIPALQFVMNVKPLLPFGSGVIPNYEVIKTFDQHVKGENTSLNYILKLK